MRRSVQSVFVVAWVCVGGCARVYRLVSSMFLSSQYLPFPTFTVSCHMMPHIVHALRASQVVKTTTVTPIPLRTATPHLSKTASISVFQRGKAVLHFVP